MTEITITPASAADVQALADLFVGHISAHPEYISTEKSLESGKDNHNAHRFFEKRGFIHVSEMYKLTQ